MTPEYIYIYIHIYIYIGIRFSYVNVSFLLLSLLLCESLSVPIPTNLTFEAYNLNTVLHWEYPRTLETPVFTVIVKTYRNGKWVHVCNTTHHYCNISSQIDDPSEPLWARVKAQLGQKESDYKESKEFILCRQGKIGPPTLIIKQKEQQIITDIYHPLKVVDGKELESMYDEETCYVFSYIIYMIKDENETSEVIYELLEEDCNETQCHLSISVGGDNSKYCLSTEGFSEKWGVTTEISEDVCITIFRDNHSSLKGSVLIAVIIPFIILVLVFIGVLRYCHMKEITPFKRKSIMLPKSLVSVVVNRASSEVRPELKNISPITYQPVVLVNEKVISEEIMSPTTVSHMHTEDNHEKENRQLPSKTGVMTPDPDVSDMMAESSLTFGRENSLHSSSNQSEPCSSLALNSYHSRNGSDSGLVESGSFLSDSESSSNKTEVRTEIQESIMLRNTTTSFGYDKPHVLVDLLVGDSGKESLIGYRLTTDSKEFS
ncbi:interferon gamma receptor 1 [Suncus etruscus]|uniref:interferon gamma receptor 1 n=1 Tax=Suncus etruscus TaxID=109475 RepID=UPI002110CB0B|nr:interferon gamma receptor 1 [Suncus etruscus]